MKNGLLFHSVSNIIVI